MKPRIIPPVYFFLFLSLMIALHFFFPVKKVVMPPYSCTGFLLIALGLAVAAWARLLFKARDLPVRPGEDLKDIETSGPFRFTRNPMYLGMTVVLLGGSIGFGSLTAFLCPLAFFVVINLIFIPFEERKMEATFGKKYLEYKHRVRRWL